MWRGPRPWRETDDCSGDSTWNELRDAACEMLRALSIIPGDGISRARAPAPQHSVHRERPRHSVQYTPSARGTAFGSPPAPRQKHSVSTSVTGAKFRNRGTIE